MKQICDQCHGTGVRCYFKGESRFLLSQDECPACCGLGFIETSDTDDASEAVGPGVRPSTDTRSGTMTNDRMTKECSNDE
jgi:hypothetical protein